MCRGIGEGREFGGSGLGDAFRDLFRATGHGASFSSLVRLGLSDFISTPNIRGAMPSCPGIRPSAHRGPVLPPSTHPHIYPSDINSLHYLQAIVFSYSMTIFFRDRGFIQVGPKM